MAKEAEKALARINQVLIDLDSTIIPATYADGTAEALRFSVPVRFKLETHNDIAIE